MKWLMLTTFVHLRAPSCTYPSDADFDMLKSVCPTSVPQYCLFINSNREAACAKVQKGKNNLGLDGVDKYVRARGGAGGAG